jgi:hypothetical protein
MTDGSLIFGKKLKLKSPRFRFVVLFKNSKNHPTPI